MNFSPGTVASGYGYSKTNTRATFPTSSGRSLLAPHLALGREDAPQLCASALRLSASTSSERSSQRGLLSMDLERWVGFAPAPHGATCPTPRLLRGRRSTRAEAAVDKSGPLRGGAPRLARTLLAPFGGPLTRADGRHTRLADPPRSTPQSGSRGGYAMGPSPRRAPTRCTRRWTLWGICSPRM
jgi:hypothetical protein